MQGMLIHIQRDMENIKAKVNAQVKTKINRK